MHERARLIRRALANGLERALHQPLRLLPTPAVMAIGRALGDRVAPALYPAQDRLARAAFRHLRPDLPLEPAMAAMWRNLGSTFAEMPRFLRFWDEGRIEVIGAEHLLETRKRRPVLLAGLHLGNPEVLGLTLARLGARPVGVATRQPTAFRERVITELRLRGGGRMIRAGPHALRPALRLLAAREETLVFWMGDYIGGEVLGPSLDRGPRVRGNIPYAVRLSRLSGCAIVPGYALRLPGGRFRTTFLPPVDASVEMLDGVLDPVVRANLSQWLFTIAWKPAA